MRSVTGENPTITTTRPPIGGSTLIRSVVLAIVLLLLRLPYLSHPIPVHPDELEFTSAIGFPTPYPVHPPGYPMWVAIGTALSRTGLSPYFAYVMWSLLASVVAPVLLYIMLRSCVDDTIALWTAAAFGVCPLTWFLSVSALTYLPACLLSLIVVWTCHTALTVGCARRAIIGAIILAIAIPLRPDLLIWLGPILLYTSFRTGPRKTWPVFPIVAAGVVTLFLVSNRLYNPDAASDSSFAHTREVLLGTSVFRLGLVDGLLRSAVKLTGFLIWALGPATILLIIAPLIRPRSFTRTHNNETRTIAILWLAPITLFFLTMHMSEAGHMLMLPPLYCLLALTLSTRFDLLVGRRIAVAVACLTAAQFVLYPWSANSKGMKRTLDAKMTYVSGQGLLHIDRRAEIHHMGDTWRTPAHDAHDRATSQPEN